MATPLPTASGPGAGAVQRVDLLWAGIERRRKHTLGSVVGVMNGAATQDLRVMRLWPVVRDVLARGTGTPRAAAAAQLVNAWKRSGGSRLDADLDGKVDSAGAAILDELWPRLAHAVLAPVLDNELRAGLAQHVPNDPPLDTNGSSAYPTSGYRTGLSLESPSRRTRSDSIGFRCC